MLIIREEQMEIFEQVALRNFENDMIDHLKDFSPDHCRVLKNDGVRKVIQLGVEKAETYGFTDRGPVKFYVEMMFMLGSYFDTDPQYPWAGRILTDEAIEQQTERADRLFDHSMDVVEKISGSGREYAIRSLQRASQLGFKELCRVEINLKASILSRMRLNFPQKCQVLGDPALNKLIEQGREMAKDYSITSNAGVICFSWIMFFLGHEFARDPLYPWCESILENEELEDPFKSMETLYSKFITYISKAIENAADRR